MSKNRQSVSTRQAFAIGRSLDVYYRDQARTARMDRLNARFVGKGDLVFDIGAHVGDRTGSFARLGASVVALEPQPRVFRALRLIQRGTPNVTLLNTAVGATSGTLKMYINSANPTVSTGSKDLIEAAQGAKEWQGQTWDSEVTVPVTTLDRLVADYGVPGFVKIDVEGFELDVLNGLGHALPALSFEFTTIQRDVALGCIDRMTQLGRYVYNYSLGENHALACSAWIDPNAMRNKIAALPTSSNSGDIFVRLMD